MIPENQVGKCAYCEERDGFPLGSCLVELYEWGYRYECCGLGKRCPDFKKVTNENVI